MAKLIPVPSESTLRRAICQALAEHPEVTLDEVRGRSRFKGIVQARHRAWQLLDEWGYGAAPIARRWGCDHSTVLNGIKRAEASRRPPKDPLAGALRGGMSDA